MATVASQYSALAATVITGVTRRFSYEPDSVATADLPAQYVRLPGMDAGRGSAFSSTCADSSKLRTYEVVVLVEAAGQDMTATAMAATVGMIDKMEAALDAVDLGYHRQYTIQATAVNKGGVPFWAVIGSIEIRG